MGNKWETQNGTYNISGGLQPPNLTCNMAANPNEGQSLDLLDC